MDDQNRILPRGETGEICVRGDLIMKGYYKAPDKTAETIIDGWLHTGDIGHIDADGYLLLTDRKKDMIITGGENVYCAEVEAALRTHPQVAHAAVGQRGHIATQILKAAGANVRNLDGGFVTWSAGTVAVS